MMKGFRLAFYLEDGGDDVDPSERIGLYESVDEPRIVSLRRLADESPACGHETERRHTMLRWLRARGPGENPCPLCQRDALVSGKLKKELRDYLTGLFSSVGVPPWVEIAASETVEGSAAAYATVNMLERQRLEHATGEVVDTGAEARRRSEETPPGKLIEVDLRVLHDATIWLDVAGTWISAMNHRWDWPYDGRLRPVQWMEDEWTPFFSNVQIEGNGDISVGPNVTRPGLLTDPKVPHLWVVRGDELTVDHAVAFGRKADFRPAWDLREDDGAFARRLLADEGLLELARRSFLYFDARWERDAEHADVREALAKLEKRFKRFEYGYAPRGARLVIVRE